MATKITSDFDYTAEELLPLVNEGIAVITKYGKSYTIGGRVFTRDDLAEMREWRRELKQEISRTSTGMAYNLARRNRKP